jgi:hypothetical protein
VPDEPAIKALLLECLEEHYGSLSAICPQPGRSDRIVRKMRELLDSEPEDAP